MTHDDLQLEFTNRWPGHASCTWNAQAGALEATCDRGTLVDVCRWLMAASGWIFAGLVVEEESRQWQLRYVFHGAWPDGWVHVLVRSPLDERHFPSIVDVTHAANWHEREAEDLFGLVFEGHPHLGDFVLHDDAWQEGVEPMRHGFSAYTPMAVRQPRTDWRPGRILRAPGAFVMPIGPVFSAAAESAHFLLETVGEDVVRAIPRLFYKYRGVEKLAEGRTPEEVLLLAERFAATTAFAHAAAYSRAVEAIAGAAVPARSETLRAFVAELERFRHHVGAIQGICESTGLAVAASQAALLEEDLLRASGALCGHRYLFGLAVPGGLATDLDDGACRAAVVRAREVLGRLNDLDQLLQQASSFLDRLEEVGLIARANALAFGLVGPIARASGVSRDLRRMQPYGDYAELPFGVPVETEGDGYARLRVLMAEARESVALMERAFERLVSGPVRVPVEPRAGSAMGWGEAPRGAAFHWLRLAGDGMVERYHIISPSFTNWLGFRLSVENFAFQDFPIILSTLDLSVSENDR